MKMLKKDNKIFFMMRIPTAYLEQKKIQRIFFSIRKDKNVSDEDYLRLMKNIYDRGALCFYLPTTRQLQLFRTLKEIAEDEYLTGIGHLNTEESISLLGKPIHYHESKVISTMIKVLPPHESIKSALPRPTSYEVLTQKEIDKITLDSDRLEKELSNFNVDVTKFILLNGKYGEWLLTLGRGDLIIEAVEKLREKGFIPIFSGRFTTFFLPKAKSIDVAAYAVPINKKQGLFSLEKACELIKKFEKPIISLNPFADGKLSKKPKEALNFIFDELRVVAAIVEVSTIEEIKRIMENIRGVPSIIPPRKT